MPKTMRIVERILPLRRDLLLGAAPSFAAEAGALPVAAAFVVLAKGICGTSLPFTRETGICAVAAAGSAGAAAGAAGSWSGEGTDAKRVPAGAEVVAGASAAGRAKRVPAGRPSGLGFSFEAEVGAGRNRAPAGRGAAVSSAGAAAESARASGAGAELSVPVRGVGAKRVPRRRTSAAGVCGCEPFAAKRAPAGRATDDDSSSAPESEAGLEKCEPAGTMRMRGVGSGACVDCAPSEGTAGFTLSRLSIGSPISSLAIPLPLHMENGRPPHEEAARSETCFTPRPSRA